MFILDPAFLRVLYRLLHLVGMAVLLGGAVLATTAFVRSGLDDDRAALRLARRYEWLFWAVLAIQVLTGLGNVGLQAEAFRGLGTSRDGFLLVKLVLVLGVLLGSLVRTEIVVGASALVAESRWGAAGMRLLAGAYGLTAATLAVLLFFALRLAHG